MWRVLLSFTRKSPFTTIQDFANYKMQGESYSRHIVEEKLNIDGQEALLTSYSIDEFDPYHPQRPIVKPGTVAYKNGVYFLFKGNLYAVQSYYLSYSQFDRVIKSIRLLKED